MLNQLEVLQDQLWAYSWNKNGEAEAHFTENIDTVVDQELDKLEETQRGSRYYRTSKATDLRKAPRTWRTRKDPFEEVWDEIRLRLELMPETTAKEIIKWLIGKYPNQFTEAQTRTLQRRVCDWRQTQQSLEQRLPTLMLQEKSGLPINSSTELVVADTLDCNVVFDNPVESLA